MASLPVCATGCLKPFRGKGGFCLFFAFLFGRGKPLSAASGMWWPDTVRVVFPWAGSEAGVTMCLQPWSNPPAEFFGFWGCLCTPAPHSPGVSLQGAPARWVCQG